MNTEEPAWEAELRSDIRRALAESDGYELDWLEPYDYQDEASAILLVFDKHIQVAEERGRREALREAAEKIRSRGTAHLAFGRAVWPFNEAADLIDPDKEKA